MSEKCIAKCKTSASVGLQKCTTLGKSVHLRYLGLRHSNITKLPESISNRRNLQTLDIYWSGCEFELSNGVLNLAQLRHLKMFQPMNDNEVRVPQGISRLRNLQTL